MLLGPVRGGVAVVEEVVTVDGVESENGGGRLEAVDVGIPLARMKGAMRSLWPAALRSRCMTVTLTTVLAMGPTGGKVGGAEARARPRLAWSHGVPAGTRMGMPSMFAQSVPGASGAVMTL